MIDNAINNVIEIHNLTKDYGNHKGVFDVNISVAKGECFGFLGPNGAGKTTTIRNIMGFIKPDKGTVTINGLDAFNDSAKIKESLGYLAGEIAFFDDMKAKELLDFMVRLQGIENTTRMNELVEFFQLDLKNSNNIKKMSKGMKQKLGIICAFMGDNDIIVLDEPTSGLDPLMQNRFIDLISEEKAKGKTIFMSSHIFEEIEKTCDRAAIIKEGKIVTIEDMESLNAKRLKEYFITFDQGQLINFSQEGLSFEVIGEDKVKMSVSNPDRVIKVLANYSVKDLEVHTQSIEEIFLHYYGGEK